MIVRSVMKRLKLSRWRDESGIGMIVALMLLLIVIGLGTFMLYMSVKSLEKGTSVQNFSAAGNASDAGIANMMAVANSAANVDGSALARHIGVENAVRGTHQANESSAEGDGLYSWMWYTEPRTDMVEGTAYNVYVSGYRKEPNEPEARTVRVLLTSTTVEGVFYDENRVANYDLPIGGLSTYGAFGNTDVRLDAGSSVKTYNSKTAVGRPVAGEGIAAVASNNTINVDGSATIASLAFHGRTGSEPLETMCIGPSCTTSPVSTIRHKLSMRDLTNKGLASCPQATYPDWIASQNGGLISTSAGPQCYNNIIFDQDTRLAGDVSTGNPAVLFAKGNISVEPGVQVASQIQRAQGPKALQIVGLSGGTTSIQAGTSTSFTGTIVGQNMRCEVGSGNSIPANHNTALMGSVACNNVIIRSGSTLWWDKQSYNEVDKGSADSKKIWTPQVFEEQ